VHSIAVEQIVGVDRALASRTSSYGYGLECGEKIAALERSLIEMMKKDFSYFKV
jgi:hypothetical protein